MKTPINAFLLTRIQEYKLHGNVNFGDKTNSIVQIRHMSIQRQELYGDITVSNAAVIISQ